MYVVVYLIFPLRVRAKKLNEKIKKKLKNVKKYEKKNGL